MATKLSIEGFDKEAFSHSASAERPRSVAVRRRSKPHQNPLGSHSERRVSDGCRRPSVQYCSVARQQFIQEHSCCLESVSASRTYGKSKLSIVIPAHNEGTRISGCLKKVRDFLDGKRGVEVIISEDGSTDDTLEVARSFAKRDRRIRILHSARRLGKGGGLVRGLKAAKGEKIVFMDADCAVEPSEIPKLLEGLDGADIAIGSRTMKGSVIARQSPLPRQIAGTAFNLLANLLFGLHSSDTQCGFKAMRKSAISAILPRLKLSGFETDVEMLVVAKRLGLRVAEVPVRWRHMEGSKVSVILESARMLNGVFGLWLGMKKDERRI